MTFSTLAKSPAPSTRTALALPPQADDTLRLALWDLSLAWRRTMSKVLLGLLLGAYGLLVIGILLLYALAVASASDAVSIRDIITFPHSLALPGYLVRYLAPLLTAILAGAVIGGEYAFATHRLSLSRGMSRAQVLAGQVLSLAFIALITAGGMLTLGLLVGVTLGPALGADLVIPYPDGWVQIAAYWLALALNLWGYMLVALFFATLGRSVAAGVGGALGLILVELVLTFLVFPLVALIMAGLHLTRAAEIFGQVPNLLFGHALGALVSYAGQGPITLMGAPDEPLALALVVVLIYCVGLIAGSYLLFRNRDIAE